MIRTTLAILAATITLVSAAPASAQELVVLHVKYADLDLGKPSGAAAFEQRVALAVLQVCGDYDSANIQQLAYVMRCRDKSRASVRPQMRAAYARIDGSPASTSLMLATR